MNDFAAFSNTIVSFMTTYLVHSTFLLAACWLLLTLSRAKSHFLAERMWKLATVLGIVTAMAQLVVDRNTFPLVMLSSASRSAPVDALSEIALDHGAETEEASHDAATQWRRQTAGTTEGPSDWRVASQTDDSRLADELAPHPFDITGDAVSSGHRLPGVSGTHVELAYESGGAGLAAVDADRLVVKPSHTAGSWLAVFAQASAIVLVCVFFAGGCLMVVQSVRWRFRLGRTNVLRKGQARTILDRFLKRHAIRRRVRLLVTCKHCEPFAFGLLRWTIVLPEAAEARLEQSELKALLAHEVAHLVRGDVRWLWIGRVSCTCFAVQPLNFLARRRWQQATEYLCDDWAIERGVRSLALARCLTQVAEWRFGDETPEVGLAVGGSKATLVRRVQRLVTGGLQKDSWRSPWRRRVLAISAAAVVVVLVIFAPRVGLPLTQVGNGAAGASVNSIEPSVGEWTTNDWQTLEEELMQLEADLVRVEELRDNGNERFDVTTSFQNLKRRAGSLRARRAYIASLIKKESQR